MTKNAPTATGLKTLRTIAANGGEMNSFAGQPGFNVGAAWDKLLRDGFLAKIPSCPTCKTRNQGDGHDLPCERPLIGQKGGHLCYIRVTLTDAGRAALA